ncbi:helix-turn-helix domain-containing protein [Neobacillus thermocopriae]|jgi:DNA-binding XRE family transcriptional regulator|uniref:helix-turn-helix transcriptional regulator n=1 Tax=Neobacillus thermocopriae TaxID=1215031 RepID=UPI002E1A5574|nr:helix-turn-helix domain-containing protein [Neobacillus thermocopriae]MED3715540.1 helix-turn-helix domain-containing protein [Neobacillus thermocopriae]
MDGYFVKILRVNLGINQEDFGKEVGVSRQTISAIESDRLAISKRLEQRILYRFNLTDEEIRAIKSMKRIFNGIDK